MSSLFIEIHTSNSSQYPSYTIISHLSTTATLTTSYYHIVFLPQPYFNRNDSISKNMVCGAEVPKPRLCTVTGLKDGRRWKPNPNDLI